MFSIFTNSLYFEHFDPRYALAFLRANEWEGHLNTVQNCIFDQPNGIAIGLIASNDISLLDNVVYKPLYTGFLLRGTKHTIKRNLVIQQLNIESVKQRSFFTGYWPSAFDLTGIDESTDTFVFEENHVSGSQTVGYRTRGFPICYDSKPGISISSNTASGCLHGVSSHFDYLTTHRCTKISGFEVENSLDYGVYLLSENSIILENVKIKNSRVALYADIFRPDPSEHLFEKKFLEVRNTIIHGRTTHDCLNHNKFPYQTYTNGMGPISPDGWNTQPKDSSYGQAFLAVLWPIFDAGGVETGRFPWDFVMGAPATYGLVQFKNTTFRNYKSQTPCGVKDLVFWTQPKFSSKHPPIELIDSVSIDVDRESFAYFMDPQLRRINPLECVNLECSGYKHTFIRDTTGTFFHTGQRSTLIPQAEKFWGDQQRGLGDFRIPKIILTTKYGQRIYPKQIAPLGRGIDRDMSKCTKRNDLNGYLCTHGRFFDEDGNDDYMQLVIEPLDALIEERRIAPVVAISKNGYLDFVNAPGRVSLERGLNVFHVILRAGRHYDIWFSSSNPQEYRLSTVYGRGKVTIKLHYPHKQRLDVHYYGSNEIISGISPKRFLSRAHKKEVVFERDSSKLMPVLSSPHGSNYQKRDVDGSQLYLTLCGDCATVVVNTAPVVLLEFGLPSVPIDEFYEKNLRQNLAGYLGIPFEKVRLVDVVREVNLPNGRRKRSNQLMSVVFEIGDQPGGSSGNRRAGKSSDDPNWQFLYKNLLPQNFCSHCRFLIKEFFTIMTLCLTLST